MVKFIRYNKIFKFYEIIQPYIKYSLHLETKLPERNVLVLAPHPDDEVIGCGGTIIQHINNGGKADVLFLTSDNKLRNQEALESSRLIGFSNTIFWDLPVNSINQQKDLYKKIIKIFEDKKPDIVFLPFWLDNHNDHRAINKILLDISKIKKFNFLVYSYPLWLPVYPNIIIDIGPVWEKKKKAIECYKSQLATRDYVKMTYSLSQYWASVKGRDLELVETYFRASFKEYINLGDKIYG